MEFSEAVRILGLEWNDSLATVRERHRLLALVWHPDRLSSQPNAQSSASEELKRINAAHDLIRETLQENGWPPAEAKDSAEEFDFDKTSDYEFRCQCGRAASLDTVLDALQVVWQSDSESATLRRLKKSGKGNSNPMLMSHLDQEGQSNPRRYDSCIGCCSCYICEKPLRATELVEKQIRNYRRSNMGRPLWTSSDFMYAHVHCYMDWQEREAAKQAETETKKREAAEAALARAAEVQLRRKAGLCVECGGKLSLLERLSGVEKHYQCKL